MPSAPVPILERIYLVICAKDQSEQEGDRPATMGGKPGCTYPSGRSGSCSVWGRGAKMEASAMLVQGASLAS